MGKNMAHEGSCRVCRENVMHKPGYLQVLLLNILVHL